MKKLTASLVGPFKPMLLASLFAIALSPVLTPVAQAQQSGAKKGPADAIEVTAMQFPAWVETNGQRQPLAPGAKVRPGQQIVTGEGARLLLRMPEGSVVKLGENAQMAVPDLTIAKEDKTTVMNSTLNVLKGAFRWTTAAVAKVNTRRNVNIQLVTVTAGIRGTDLWGRQGGEREIVCLIEGKIQIDRSWEGGQEAPITMSEPLQFYVADKGQKNKPIGAVSLEQLSKWAQETEIAEDSGAQRGGKVKVSFGRSNTTAEALTVYDQLRSIGLAANIEPRSGKQLSYEVIVSGIANARDAQSLIERVGRLTNLQGSVK